MCSILAMDTDTVIQIQSNIIVWERTKATKQHLKKQH